MASADIPPEQGSLERLGVAIETEIPEEILKPSVIRALRFRQQAKLGYYTKDVEAFVQEKALTSVEWYIQRLHARDLDVHRLGEELDRLEIDMMNVRAQFEMAAASAPIAAAIAQAEQDPEVEAIVARARQDQADLAAAYERINALEADLAAVGNSAPVQDAAIETRIAELEGELEAAEEERDNYALLLSQAQEQGSEASAEAPGEDVAANVRELEEYAQQQDDYIDLLLNRIDELEALLPSGVEAPAAEAAEQPEGDEIEDEFEGEAELEGEEEPEEQEPVALEEIDEAEELPADGYEEEEAADELVLPESEPLDPATEFGYAFGASDDDDFDLVAGREELIGQEPDQVEYEEVTPEEDRDQQPREPRHVWNGIELPEGLTPEDFQ